MQQAISPSPRAGTDRFSPPSKAKFCISLQCDSKVEEAKRTEYINRGKLEMVMVVRAEPQPEPQPL